MHGNPVGTDEQCEHDERDDLTGVCFGRGHSDLWSSIDVDSTAGLSTDGAADCVGDSHA